MIYTIHFDEKLAHSQHYIGFCEDHRLEERFAQHLSGQGAKILAECNRRGIHYSIVETRQGD